MVDQWLDLSQTRDLAELAGTLDAHLAPRYGMFVTRCLLIWFLREVGEGEEGEGTTFCNAKILIFFVFFVSLLYNKSGG